MILTYDKNGVFLGAFDDRRTCEASWRLSYANCEVILEHMRIKGEEVQVVSCAGNTMILGKIIEVPIHTSPVHL